MTVLASDAIAEAASRRARIHLNCVAVEVYADSSEFCPEVSVGRTRLDLNTPTPTVWVLDYDEDLYKRQNVRLSNQDRGIFIALIASDEEPSETLRSAAEEYKRKYT